MSNSFNKQADYTAYVKYFNTNSQTLNQTTWYNTKYDEKKALTPVDKTIDVYIPNNLYVGGSINGTSDIQMKEKIEIVDDSILEKLDCLQPKQYHLKKDSVKKTHYGFIAQDVEEYFPELVSEIEIEGEEDNIINIKTVNYLELIPIMLKKIHDLQKRIHNLEGKQT